MNKNYYAAKGKIIYKDIFREVPSSLIPIPHNNLSYEAN